MKIMIKHQESEVVIDDGYNSEYRTPLKYPEQFSRLKELITTIVKDLKTLKQ